MIVPVAAVADTFINSAAFFIANARLAEEPASVTFTPSEVAPEISPTVPALSYSRRVVVPPVIEVELTAIVVPDGLFHDSVPEPFVARYWPAEPSAEGSV